MAQRLSFPNADSPLALDLWHLGKAAVSRYALLSRTQVYESLQAAALAHRTGVSLQTLLEPRSSTILCGRATRGKRAVRRPPMKKR